MVSGSVERRNQQDEEMHPLAVQAVEVDPLSRPADVSHDAAHGLVLGMGDRDSVADYGRAELLALEDRRNDSLLRCCGYCSGLDERADHLTNCLQLRRGLEIRHGRRADDEIEFFGESGEIEVELGHDLL